MLLNEESTVSGMVSRQNRIAYRSLDVSSPDFDFWQGNKFLFPCQYNRKFVPQFVSELAVTFHYSHPDNALKVCKGLQPHSSLHAVRADNANAHLTTAQNDDLSFNSPYRGI